MMSTGGYNFPSSGSRSTQQARETRDSDNGTLGKSSLFSTSQYGSGLDPTNYSSSGVQFLGGQRPTNNTTNSQMQQPSGLYNSSLDQRGAPTASTFAQTYTRPESANSNTSLPSSTHQRQSSGGQHVFGYGQPASRSPLSSQVSVSGQSWGTPPPKGTAPSTTQSYQTSRAQSNRGEKKPSTLRQSHPHTSPQPMPRSELPSEKQSSRPERQPTEKASTGDKKRESSPATSKKSMTNSNSTSTMSYLSSERPSWVNSVSINGTRVQQYTSPYHTQNQPSAPSTLSQTPRQNIFDQQQSSSVSGSWKQPLGTDQHKTPKPGSTEEPSPLPAGSHKTHAPTKPTGTPVPPISQGNVQQAESSQSSPEKKKKGRPRKSLDGPDRVSKPSGRKKKNVELEPEPANMEAHMKQMMETMREYQAKDPSAFHQIWEQLKKNPQQARTATPPTTQSPTVAPTRPSGAADARNSRAPARVPPVVTPTLDGTQLQGVIQPAQLPASVSSQTTTSPVQPPSQMQTVPASTPVSYQNPSTPVQTLNAPANKPSQAQASAPKPPITSGTPAANPPTSGDTLWPDSQKALLAREAVKALTIDPRNNGKYIAADTVHKLLDKNPSYVELCIYLENLGFKIERSRFARQLLQAVASTTPTTVAKQQDSNSTVNPGAQLRTAPPEPPAQPFVNPAHLTMANIPSYVPSTHNPVSESRGQDTRPIPTISHMAPNDTARPQTGDASQPSSTNQQTPPTTAPDLTKKDGSSKDIPMTSSNDMRFVAVVPKEEWSRQANSKPGEPQTRPPTQAELYKKYSFPTEPPSSRRPPAKSPQASNGYLLPVAPMYNSPYGMFTPPSTQSQKSPKGSSTGVFQDANSIPHPHAPREPQSKAEAAYKHSFGEIVDLLQNLSDDEDDYSPQVGRASKDQSKISQFSAGNTRVSTPSSGKPQAKDNPYRFLQVVVPIDRKKALRRNTYDPKTIATDVLLAAGRHPLKGGLNARLEVLKKNFHYIPNDADLSTFRWDLVDPGGPPPPIHNVSMDSIHGERQPGLRQAVMIDDDKDGDHSIPSHDIPRNKEDVLSKKRKRVSSLTNDNPTVSIDAAVASLNAASARLLGSSASASRSHPPSKDMRGLTQAPASDGKPAKRRGRPIGWRKPKDTTSQSTPTSHTHSGQPGGFRTVSSPARAIAVVVQSPRSGRSVRSVSTNQSSKMSTKSESQDQRHESEASFAVYNCKWDHCKAQLHNIETLSRHLHKVHKKKGDDNIYRCFWADCGPVTHINDSQTGEMRPVRQGLVLFDEKAWNEHIKVHVEQVSESLGAGPYIGSPTSQYSARQHSDSLDYLRDVNGNLVTPLVREISSDRVTATERPKKRRRKGKGRPWTHVVNRRSTSIRPSSLAMGAPAEANRQKSSALVEVDRDTDMNSEEYETFSDDEDNEDSILDDL